MLVVEKFGIAQESEYPQIYHHKITKSFHSGHCSGFKLPGACVGCSWLAATSADLPNWRFLKVGDLQVTMGFNTKS